MNINELEHDLRDALAVRADEVPADAVRRVRAHHYRPQTRALRPPVAVGGVTAAAAAGVAVWLFALSPQTSSAFAGWTATPGEAAPGQVSTAESSCQSRVAGLPSPPTKGSAQTQPVPELAGAQPVLTDTRGMFTWVILAASDTNSYASCISGPSLSAVSASSSTTPVSASAGHLALSSSSQMRTPAGDSYSFAEGRTGSGVIGATLVLADGTHVQATLENGWFAAWWPTDQPVSSALVATANGTTTEQLPAGTGSCPPAPSGSHGPSSCTHGFSSGAGRTLGITLSSAGSAKHSGSTASPGSPATVTAPSR